MLINSPCRKRNPSNNSVQSAFDHLMKKPLVERQFQNDSMLSPLSTTTRNDHINLLRRKEQLRLKQVTQKYMSSVKWKQEDNALTDASVDNTIIQPREMQSNVMAMV